MACHFRALGTGRILMLDHLRDAVAFGVPFIANPDLPARLKADAPLNEARTELFYAKGPVGYIDYPMM